MNADIKALFAACRLMLVLNNSVTVRIHSFIPVRMTTNIFIAESLLALFVRKWLGTRRSCLVVADTADTTVVSAVSATKRHDRFFYLPTKNPSFTLINDFVVDS